MTNGDRVIIRWPLSPWNMKASATMPHRPRLRRARETHVHVRPGASAGEIEQNASMAERYMKTAHSVGDNPDISGPGDSSFTMRMPMLNSASVRPVTCKIVFQHGTPARKRPPSANGIDMPTMKRNAGKTISTNVIPLRPWKWRIQSGTILGETPAISLTKIMVNMTKPRNASIDVMRGTGGGVPGDSTTVLMLRTLYKFSAGVQQR